MATVSLEKSMDSVKQVPQIFLLCQNFYSIPTLPTTHSIYLMAQLRGGSHPCTFQAPQVREDTKEGSPALQDLREVFCTTLEFGKPLNVFDTIRRACCSSNRVPSLFSWLPCRLSFHLSGLDTNVLLSR